MTAEHDVVPSLLAATVEELAGTALGETTIADVLRVLALGAVRILDADGACVMVPDGPDGPLRRAFATSAAVEELATIQEAHGEGPGHECLSMTRIGRTDLDHGSGERWPRLTRRATELGLHSVTSVPLLARGKVWGVVDVYHAAHGPLAPTRLQALRTVANLATSYLVMLADRESANGVHPDVTIHAMHDPLTGLPTRGVLFEQLGHALALLDRRRGEVAVLFIDLDGLKQINDTLGHHAGDTLITSVVERIRAVLRPADILARLGGDEFVVVLEALDDGHDAERVAQRVQTSIARPLRVTGRTVLPSASIGIAFGDGSVTADTLVSHADAAMYAAKRAGRGRSSVFDPDAYAAERADTTAREQMWVDLRAALTNDELELHYQPILDLVGTADVSTAEVGPQGVYAVEALLRWHHPLRGLLTARDFIDAAVAGDLIVDVGAWVVRTACRQLRTWDIELGGLTPQRVFVNISAEELVAPSLADSIADTLAETGLEADRLILEITETSPLTVSPAASQSLERLRGLGCRIAIDGFGTGYSSMSRLLQVDAATLKIDRSFTRGIPGDRDSTAVVSSLLLLGHNLRRTVIVEGVEAATTLQALRELGATQVQGYHLARPQDVRSLEVSLRTQPWNHVESCGPW